MAAVLRTCCLASLGLWLLLATSPSPADVFTEQVAPLFERRCLGCHHAADRNGGLSLETAADLLDSGYVEPGDADASVLIDVVTPAKGKAAMPKTGDPLSTQQIAVLRRWIDDGAKWPEGLSLAPNRLADLDWWSLKPLTRPALPGLPDNGSPALQHPVDRFIAARLDPAQLTLSPPADRRTLIRRLTYDLWGLPPTPQEVAAFLDDPDPQAYERLVERLLASPRYGERWARHWLDVVHYADTHGYDKDKLRPNAWPYRDYVIRALNEDKPYARFVQEQIAGDVLFPGTVDGLVATGFIAAGPWDLIGHAEVPESKIDGQIARHLDRDDMVSTTFNTFCSLTVQCARCHNHKFDPVGQEHYYSLQAVFAALDRADRPYDLDPQVARRRAELAELRRRLEIQKQELVTRVQEAGGAELAELDARIRRVEGQKAGPGDRAAAFGYHSAVEPQPDRVKWVQVDLGEPTPIREVIYVGCHDNFNNIGPGFGFPRRYRIEVSHDPEFRQGVTVVADHTAADVPNPGTRPQIARVADLSARYLRVTATRLAPRQNDFIFALAELSVVTPDGVNAARGKPVSSLDSIEAPVRWSRANLVDGYYHGGHVEPESTAALAQLNAARQALLARKVDAGLRAAVEANQQGLQQAEAAVAALPPQSRVYAGMIHHGSGAFLGTGANGGRPREIHVLHRGNILEPRQRVEPGTVPIIPGADWRFSLPADHTEGDRRAALARWLVDPRNPLTWRSIVNRVWQYHFGRGLVDSPNDFGRMGQLPTHPELLDWLAVEFRDGGGSLKQLHRLLVTSAVYRQSSASDPAKAARDADNVWWWRMNRRRLEAEAIRDSVLAISGRLDDRMYGPGFQAFVLEKPEHSPHYEYQKSDPDDPATHRRSIYRFLVRSQPDPFMNTLDCADSAQSVAKRDETLTALQALALLNNKFMTRMAEHFAARLQRDRTALPEQIDLAMQLIAARKPNPAEHAELVGYAEAHGLANLCRVLFNLNEFVFVD